MTTSLDLTPAVYKVVKWSPFNHPDLDDLFEDFERKTQPDFLKVTCVRVTKSEKKHSKGEMELTIGERPVVVYIPFNSHWCDAIKNMSEDNPVHIAGSFDDIRRTEEYRMMHPFD